MHEDASCWIRNREDLEVKRISSVEIGSLGGGDEDSRQHEDGGC